MDRDNFFGNLRGEGESNETLRFQQQLAYEERCIKRVFTECGVKISNWGRFANESREVTGQDRITFDWFNGRFRSFPGTLLGKRIPGLHELTLLDLFKANKPSRLVRAVAKALGNTGQERFVFMFPVTRTMFVASDIQPERRVTRVSLVAAGGDHPLYVEPSKTFFAAVGAEWFTDSYM